MPEPTEEERALARLVAGYKREREDGDSSRTEYGFMVILTVPNTLSREDVERDLRNSVEFGQPDIALLYDVPAPRPVEVASPTGARL